MSWDTTNLFIESIDINNFAYDAIFKHSTNPEHIKIGLKWMEGVIRRNPEPNHIDTYANLLYKSGKRHEAIIWQTKAVDIAKRKMTGISTVYRRILKK